MKTIFLLFLAQVTYTPPIPPGVAVPGRVLMVAGALTCTVQADAFPATAITLGCSGSLNVPASKITLPVGASYVLSLGIGGDKFAFLAKHDAGQPISFQATVTPNGGAEGPAVTGTL
jgi:hypothetical protein